ncbi:MAG TPA: M14 family zinc carboxypeptidase [Pyrinomonadaceae bacterium]|nr:M14 family zinc carboxypeptidase [Pyrinomonadaceae bacterium]
MNLRRISISLGASLLIITAAALTAHAQANYTRDPNQPKDEEYTRKIAEYTTEKFFNSPLTDYLPASPNVPTPKAVLGDVAGAPGKLPYSEEVYRYMRMLEKASPRVKVYSIGTTEEGREMIAVAIASESLLARLDENRARLNKLADPRTINLNDAEADRLVADTFPIYYITGALHSTETGSPTALMELAYRLAVDESPYIKGIRDGMVTLITPVVEADGRDRMVDVYNWHLANPGKNWPNLLYWGHYVAHDNNRDAMALSLKLTRNVLNTYLTWKPQVLHDLHESVPYLYDNTIGDGPYNAWVDPILTDEWQMIGWQNVSEMTKFGMPGVFAHGTFDTWSPGYLMFIAATHNGISRLYETFGNAGADTLVRTLSPSDYERTWYKQNPPLPRARWSQRNNNNYQQTALLISLDNFNRNGKLFLKNFYLKSKRSVEKPKNEGPAAYVFPSDDPRPGNQATILRILQAQGCEVHRATAPFTVSVRKKASNRGGAPRVPESIVMAGPTNPAATPSDAVPRASASPSPATVTPRPPDTESRTFPAGSYLVRMDQPYSRMADALLDYQYWSPRDPQQNVYDDTGWTFGELGNIQVVRVTDAKVLNAAMDRVTGEVRSAGGVTGNGSIYLVNANADNSLITLRYRLRRASFDAAEEPFEAAGKKFNRGSFIIRNASADEVNKATSELGIQAFAIATQPTVKTHPVKAARVAIMHTWLSTQDEGWWRLAFDQMGVPFDYISTQDVAKDSDLNKKYDVIIFGPGGGNVNAVIQGRPMYGNPIPWKTTSLTPNIGKIDSTDDIRPGLGLTGVMNLQNFVKNGGVFIGSDDAADFAVSSGFTPGVSIQRSTRLRAIGIAAKTRMIDSSSPIAYGYSDTLSVYTFNGPIFNISNVAGGGGGRRAGGGQRATGRGTVDDPDVVQGRPPAELPEPPPPVEVWEAAPVPEEQRRNLIGLIPPTQRPRVILRWGDARELLVSGLLDGGDELAQHAAVIDSPLEKGHVILFSNNPMWRGQTMGSYSLVFNVILNFDNLNAGRKLNEK